MEDKKVVTGQMGELSEEVTGSNFKKFSMSLVESSKKTIDPNEDSLPLLFVVQQKNIYAFPLPVGLDAINEALTGIAATLKGAQAYVYIAATWALTTGNEKEIAQYTEHPEDIAENPFKDERMRYEARGFGQEYQGYYEITHEEDGNIKIGTELIATKEKMSLVDVAGMLESMIGD